MSKISLYTQLLLLTGLLLGCAVPSEIPTNYLMEPKSISAMPNGCWISINQSNDLTTDIGSKISGELIAVQKDTFYIMSQTSLEVVPAKKITAATLYLFKNQASKYILATGLGLVPNIAGAIAHGMSEFLAIGIPFAIVGIVNASIEVHANELRFPKKNNLDEFGKFARFPQGMPSGVDVKSLTLISNSN